MAICTQCGAVMHDDDMLEHVCKEMDRPQKGQIKKPVTTIEIIQKEEVG